MKTPKGLYSETKYLYACELESCPVCDGPMQIIYTSSLKMVQTKTSVFALVHLPKRCADPNCTGQTMRWPSARWLQTAPRGCTYGYDVIAQIGWQRQTGKETFECIHASLKPLLRIGETQVRMLYHERYLALLACHERQFLGRLEKVAAQTGLRLSLDGLAPEGGEPQLWVVRELLTGITLRSGWLAQQDEGTFVRFLQPIADLGLPVQAVLSDKQRGLVPAVAVVFPTAKHTWCQAHYLNNAAKPVAEADEAMKIALRQCVREEIGDVIRQEKVEQVGVLTITGGLPSPTKPNGGVELPQSASTGTTAPISPPAVELECEAIRQDLRRRIRYLLTLKGRPPLRLAGVEMFARLSEVRDCLDRLLARHADPQLLHLRQGLQIALVFAQVDYALLRQAADWLEHITYILDPQDRPARSGNQVQQEIFDYLEAMRLQSQDQPRLAAFYQTIYHTTCNYAPGLFHSYDIPGLPRTNNARESEFRELNRRLLSTTGQKGLVKRIVQREGAWEVIPRPTSLEATVKALSLVSAEDFQNERQRVREHRSRFRLHTRSAKQSRSQLKRLEQRWFNLHATNSSS